MMLVTGTSTRIKTALDSITVNRTLTFTTTGTAGITLAMGAFRLIDGGNFSIVNSGAALKNITTAYTNVDTSYKPIPVNQSWPGAVTYNATGHQTVVSGYYAGAVSVNGGARTFSAMGTIEVAGAFTASTTSTTYTLTGTTFLFSGGAQALAFAPTSAVSFNNL